MGTEGEALQAFVAAFVEENPDVEVNVTAVPWDAAHDKIATAIAGGQTPDVSMIGTTWMGEFAATGALAHPGGADHRDVGGLPAGDGGGDLVVRGIPRDRGDVDLDVGVLLDEGRDEGLKGLALSAHRPYLDGAGGRSFTDGLGGFLGAAAPGGVASATGEREGCHGDHGGAHAGARNSVHGWSSPSSSTASIGRPAGDLCA